MFACDIPGCRRQFGTKWGWKEHRMHAHMVDVMWVACDFPGCDKRFKSNGQLQTHRMRAHSAGVRVPVGAVAAPVVRTFSLVIRAQVAAMMPSFKNIVPKRRRSLMIMHYLNNRGCLLSSIKRVHPGDIKKQLMALAVYRHYKQCIQEDTVGMKEIDAIGGLLQISVRK